MIPRTPDDATIPQLFLDRVERSSEETALLIPREGSLITITWRALLGDVVRVLSWISGEGIRPGSRVVLVSENRFEWVVTDLAIQLAGAIHVPLHSVLTATQINAFVDDCRPSLIVVSNQQQLDKVRSRSLPVLTFDRCVSSVSERRVTSLSDLPLANPDVAEMRRRVRELVTADSILTILYTSGTMGESKGVVLSQRNVVSNALGKLTMLPLGADDVRWCMLPMSHIFARCCDIYTWMIAGCQMALSQGKDHWLTELALIRPTYINSVPYFYEKLYRVLRERGHLDHTGALRQLLGDRVQICNCGGAPIDDLVFDYFRRQGINLVTGYGLTETSPVVTSSTVQKVKRGAVGVPLPDVQVRIAADGEVLVRGPNVMRGYFKNDRATRDVFRDGWFYTGDLGRIDHEGFLFIEGRKKELIVTSGGRNVSPVTIERLLNAHPLIAQSAVFGDRRDFLVALVTLDSNRASSGQSESTADASLRPRLRAAIDEQLRDLAPYQQIIEFAIVENPFTVGNQLMTAKGSIRRNSIYSRYEAVIERMYRSPVTANE